jgi:hypothetical protein
VVIVRLMLCHFRDQQFEVVAHTLLHRSYGERRRNERSIWPRINIEDVEKYSMSPDRQPTKKDGCRSFCRDTSVSVHGIVAGGLWHRTTARPPYQLRRCSRCSLAYHMISATIVKNCANKRDPPHCR